MIGLTTEILLPQEFLFSFLLFLFLKMMTLNLSIPYDTSHFIIISIIIRCTSRHTRPLHHTGLSCNQVLLSKWCAVEIKGLGDQFQNQLPSPYISTACHFNGKASLEANTGVIFKLVWVPFFVRQSFSCQVEYGHWSHSFRGF